MTKKCPRRHRISKAKFEKLPIHTQHVPQIEKPQIDTRYNFREVELIQCGYEQFKIRDPPQNCYVNLARSYIPCTIVPLSSQI